MFLRARAIIARPISRLPSQASICPCISSIWRREPTGTWTHLGPEEPGFQALCFSRNDPDLIISAARIISA